MQRVFSRLMLILEKGFNVRKMRQYQILRVMSFENNELCLNHYFIPKKFRKN